MLAVLRFRVSVGEAPGFRRLAGDALRVLAKRPGFRNGQIGRAADDPALWTLSTRWDGPGAYRRAISSYEVKADAVPLLSRALEEPTAYEILDEVDAPA